MAQPRARAGDTQASNTRCEQQGCRPPSQFKTGWCTFVRLPVAEENVKLLRKLLEPGSLCHLPFFVSKSFSADYLPMVVSEVLPLVFLAAMILPLMYD